MSDPYKPAATNPLAINPEPRNEVPSSLDSYGHTPLSLQGSIRQVLLAHFADPENMVNPVLRAKFSRDGGWKPTKDSGLYIEALDKWNPNQAESRPALLIKLGAWQWEMGAIGNLSAVDVRSGVQKYYARWRGDATIFAVTKEPPESMILGIEVAKLIGYFSVPLGSALRLQQLELVSAGPVAEMKESTENYAFPVSFRYVVPEHWQLQEDAPRLKRIIVAASPQAYTFTDG